MFLNYTADFFIESGSNFTPNQSSLIVGVILVLGSFASLALVNRFSRKFLYSLTSIGTMLPLITMGIYSSCKFNGVEGIESFKFIPVVSLSVFIFIGSLGRIPLTFVIMSEIMPQKVRSFGISIANTCNWLLAFVLLQFFSTAVKALQFHNCMYIFSFVVFLGMIFVMFCVPETRNKSFEEIERSLDNKKVRIEESLAMREVENLKA
jgi:hypothetical protein